MSTLTTSEQINKQCEQIMKISEQTDKQCEQIIDSCKQIMKISEQTDKQCEQTDKQCEQIIDSCKQINNKINRNLKCYTKIYLICMFMISFGLLSIYIISFFIRYYPYLGIELNDGYCNNSNVTLFRTKGYIFYETKIYDEINGTFIGNSSGCIGTYKNSYKLSPTNTNSFDSRPYNSDSGNLPTWLCSFEDDNSQLWEIFETENLTNQDINEYIFGDNWNECKYSSLHSIKHNKWHNLKLSNYDYISSINIFGGGYKSIKYSKHYKKMITIICISSLPLFFVLFSFMFIR